MKKLKEALDPLGIPVFSFVPSNQSGLFIYMGNISTYESQLKDDFLITGILNVTLYTGTNEWIGSLKEPLQYFNDIKVALQPTKGDVLDLEPDFSMIYFKLYGDNGVQQITPTDRIYVGNIQYEFQIGQN